MVQLVSIVQRMRIHPPGKQNSETGHRRAFTLVELLVTISIIGILAALLLPALSKAKARALNVACLNNFHQLMVGWKMYADDNHGHLVPVYYFEHGTSGPVDSNTWVLGSMNDDTSEYPPVEPGVLDSTNVNGITLGSLYHYNNSAKVYHCPADKSRTAGVPRVRSYSINGWMGGTSSFRQHDYRIFKTESDIVAPSPSAAWVLIDEHESTINDGFFPVDMDGNWGMFDAPATRHNNSYALSFADGHAELWKLTDSRTMNWTPSPTRDWNSPPISNNPTNADWQRLRNATTSLK